MSTANRTLIAAKDEGGSVDYLSSRSRIRVADLLEAKRRSEKWVMLTSYDAISAKVFDSAKIPCLLVGDSAAQVVFGYKSTTRITLDEMIPLAKAVTSSTERALVIGDMPFGSYQKSPEWALDHATRFTKEADVHAVKMEGGAELKQHVKLLTQSGIPVMGHVGFTPQHEHMLSGFKVQGRNTDSYEKVLTDAIELEAAGAFALVLELVPSELGKKLAETLKIPIIGIGAGPSCDAQVLVWSDMVGFSAPKGGKPQATYLGEVPSNKEKPVESVEGKTSSEANPKSLELERAPKFVKRYANVSEIIYNAAVNFAADVRQGVYPAKEHCYQ